VDPRRQLAAEAGDAELGPVLDVARPLAGEVQRLAALDARQGAGDGDGLDAGAGGISAMV